MADDISPVDVKRLHKTIHVTGQRVDAVAAGWYCAAAMATQVQYDQPPPKQIGAKGDLARLLSV